MSQWNRNHVFAPRNGSTMTRMGCERKEKWKLYSPWPCRIQSIFVFLSVLNAPLDKWECGNAWMTWQNNWAFIWLDWTDLWSEREHRTGPSFNCLQNSKGCHWFFYWMLSKLVKTMRGQWNLIEIIWSHLNSWNVSNNKYSSSQLGGVLHLFRPQQKYCLWLSVSFHVLVPIVVVDWLVTSYCLLCEISNHISICPSVTSRIIVKNAKIAKSWANRESSERSWDDRTDAEICHSESWSDQVSSQPHKSEKVSVHISIKSCRSNNPLMSTGQFMESACWCWRNTWWGGRRDEGRTG